MRGLGVLAVAGAVSCARPPQPPRLKGKADYTVRIGAGNVELAPGRTVSTTLYGGQFPGPLLRFTEGKPTVVDIYNDTDTPEQLHWHGQTLAAEVDGAAEEGTPYIAAHGRRRLSFTPGPAGFRFYHSHLTPGGDLSGGQYSGQVGPVYVEPRHHPGAYDQEVFLTLKEFEPSLTRGQETDADFLAGAHDPALRALADTARAQALSRGTPPGYEVSYRAFTINGRMLGAGDPIRVKTGERVLFHVLNGSATEERSLALPGHMFTVVELDGNPVPKPVAVPVLWLGTAERISALVEMNQPGVWILGDLSDEARRHGMGIVVEYAGRSGQPLWVPPPLFRWDYRVFAHTDATPAAPDYVIDLLIEKQNAADNGFNVWTINGQRFSMQSKQPLIQLHRGGRYRLRLRNASDDVHSIHLHRHTFEITRFAGTPTAGVRKDVAMIGDYQVMEIDFVADQPGLSLFHCHQQLHMDFGFMALFHCS
ncbi:multicopper oxidase family protein [Mycobacterium botniense]|uniref:multicopper oxidase family protein n=1 Tax=Mycobacterium botniense TaxID=84962 RepID=UPI001FE61CAC|nr:multicopper oxidase domain-containing protein [Mycobacterium botniense]